MSWKIHNIGILLLLILSASCKERIEQKAKKEQWQHYSKNVIETHLKKQIILPDSATNLAFPMSEVDSVMNQPFKVLVNVDIDCKACLSKFYFWSQFYCDLVKNKSIHIPVIMYINSEQPQMVKEQVEKYWNGFWLYDKKYEFLDKNDLHDDRFQAVLIDKNKRIRLIGNPVHNERLSELYKNAITSLLKEYETKKSI